MGRGGNQTFRYAPGDRGDPYAPRPTKGRDDRGLFNSDHRVNPRARFAFASPEMRAFEQSIARSNTETAGVFDADGKLIGQSGGTSGSVRVTIPMRDRIVTHNHPNGNPAFSEQDIMTGVLNNVRAIRVVTATTVTTLERPAKGWPPATKVRREWLSAYLEPPNRRPDGNRDLTMEMFASKTFAAAIKGKFSLATRKR